MLGREQLQKIEVESIQKILETSPELLKTKPYIEDENYLEKIGIFIGRNKEIQSKGYLKLWPEDFLVEEIDKKNKLASISIGSADNQEKNNSDFSKNKNIEITLVKCHIGTLEAISDMSKQLNCDKNKIKHAGLKDFDAITAQKITLSGTTLEKIKKIYSNYFFIKDITETKKMLEPGELSGNQFTILIRTKLDKENLENFRENLLEIKKKGFWNYYYTQRFGNNGRLNGHLLGKLFIEEKYEEALIQFLTEAPDASKMFAKNIYKQISENYGDWNKIEQLISPYPITFERELKMVRYLKENPNDFSGAINSQENEIKLWILGFASWLFNLKISEFIKNNEIPPKEIPLITSKDTNDQEIYFEILEKIGMKKEKINFDELSKFNVQKAKFPVETKKMVDIQKVFSSPQGIILQFSLDKGSYATTFLSHLINLVSGEIPEEFSKERVDITKALGRDSIVPVTEYFKEII